MLQCKKSMMKDHDRWIADAGCSHQVYGTSMMSGCPFSTM
jgi:hypothetical protein